MAKAPIKTEESAEKAYAAASAGALATKPAARAKKAPIKKAAAKKSPVKKPAPVPVAAPAPIAEAPEPVAVAPEPVAPVAEVPELAAPVAEAPEPATTAVEAPEPVAAVAEPLIAEAPEEVAAPIEITPPKPTLIELKEKIMATAKTPDFAKPVTDAVAEIQTRAKVAYEKGTESLTEATEFAKGNVEALVESGKIYAAGAQDLGKTYVEEAKSAYETLSADLKEMAAIKSPTELFQLQGKIMRRNFDALMATSSKNSEAVLKLANDTFAPLTGRVTLATEKLAKVA